MTVKTFNPKQTTTLETPKKVIEELSDSNKKPLKTASTDRIGGVSLGDPTLKHQPEKYHLY